MNDLATIYLEGYIEGDMVEEDCDKGMWYLTKADSLGVKDARFWLLDIADGYFPDLPEDNITFAFAYINAVWKKMEEKEKVDSWYILGNFYLNGDGVLKDEEEGLKWIKKASENGNEEAIHFM